MSDELTKKLLEYLNSSVAFVKEQAPDYVQQALAFYAWDARFNLYCCLGVALLFFALTVWSIVYSWRSDDSGFAILAALPALVWGLTCIGIEENYSTLRKIEIAPKVFLVEKLTDSGCHK